MTEGDVVAGEGGLRQQIVDRTRELLPGVLGRDIPVIPEDASLTDDLGLTSSATLELLLELEESLGIEVDVEELDEDSAGTVGTLADYIVGHLLSDELAGA